MHQPTTAEQKAGATTGQKINLPEKRVFINERGEGTFICPACEQGVIKDLSELRQTPSAVRIKCKCTCGHIYRVLLERRRQFRKAVDLVGMFSYRGGSGPPRKGLIKIRDISRSGIQFTVNSMPDFEVGDTLMIEFTLDDEERSPIREKGVVRRIHSNRIGLEFKTTDHYGKLGQYLFR